MLFINNLLVSLTSENLIKFIIAVAIIVVLLLIARFLYKKSKEADYFVKQRLLTQTELEYYEIIRSLISSQYVPDPFLTPFSLLNDDGNTNICILKMKT